MEIWYSIIYLMSLIFRIFLRVWIFVFSESLHFLFLLLCHTHFDLDSFIDIMHDVTAFLKIHHIIFRYFWLFFNRFFVIKIHVLSKNSIDILIFVSLEGWSLKVFFPRTHSNIYKIIEFGLYEYLNLNNNLKWVTNLYRRSKLILLFYSRK